MEEIQYYCYYTIILYVHFLLAQSERFYAAIVNTAQQLCGFLRLLCLVFRMDISTVRLLVRLISSVTAASHGGGHCSDTATEQVVELNSTALVFHDGTPLLSSSAQLRNTDT